VSDKLALQGAFDRRLDIPLRPFAQFALSAMCADLFPELNSSGRLRSAVQRNGRRDTLTAIKLRFACF